MSDFDNSALAALRKHGRAATYVVRNILDMGGRRGLRTARVLAALKRLEKRGLAERVPSSYLVMLTWQAVQVATPALAEVGR